MRVGVASAFSTCVGLWARLKDEGADVRVWRGSVVDDSPKLMTSHRLVGQGIVGLEDSWYGLLAWCREGMRSGEPTMMLFDSSGLGRLADEARRAGVYVVGGGSFCDRLEKDRSFGRSIVEKNGVPSPPLAEFASIDACLAYAQAGGVDKPVYFKTDSYLTGDATHKCEDTEELIEWLTYVKKIGRSNMSCTLEEKIDGAAISTARYWNGRSWVGPYEGTFERKSFFPDGVGPSTGCSTNAVWFYENDAPEIAEALNWNALTEPFLRAEAPPGIYDQNAIVKDGEAFFLEHTPRMGWDSEGTSHLLFDDYLRWLWFVATGQGENVEPRRGDIGLSIRLSVPPAPWEYGEKDERGSAVGIPVRGDTGDLWSEGFVGYNLMLGEDGLEVASPEGLVGLSAEVGAVVSDLAIDVIESAKDLRCPGLMFWPSGVSEAIIADAEGTDEAGFGDFPAGLMA